jgi:hypothetical protein
VSRPAPRPCAIALVVAGATASLLLARPASAATVTLTADPLVAALGAAVTLAWTAANATACHAERGWSGERPTAGDEQVSPGDTTTYRLRCEGPAGTAMREVTVAVKGDDCEAVDTCQIESPTRTCLFPLALAADAVVRVAVRAHDTALDARWRIVTASGTAAASCGGLRAGEADCGPLPAGSYTLEVSAASGAGSATVHRQRLSACTATRVDCEQEVHDAIETAADADLFAFTADPGERVRVTVRELSGTLDAEWRLLTATGGRAGSCDTFRRSLAEDCGPLAAGAYRLHVRDEAGQRTGAYAVSLTRLSGARACDVVPIRCDQTRQADIHPGTDADLFRFSVDADEVVRVVVDERGGPLVAEWRLLTLDGTPAPACGAFTTARAADCGPLPSGEYHLHVKDDIVRGTGAYELSLYNLVRVCANCGNGILSVGEECDPPGPCCTAECTLVPAGTMCRPTAGPCDVAERCTGVTPACPADAFVPAGTLCRAAGGPCDEPEQCSGLAAACPPDAKRTTVCRPADGPCDLPERCDGRGDACPADRLAPAGTICRESADACDATERCPGGTVECPPDRRAPLRCGDGCLDVREQCGEPGATACAAGQTCAGCVCLACAAPTPVCEAPDAASGRVTVRLTTQPGAGPLAAWAGTLVWDPSALRLETIDAGTTAGLGEPACAIHRSGGTAVCSATGLTASLSPPAPVELARAHFTPLSSAEPHVRFTLHELRRAPTEDVLVCPTIGTCAILECGAAGHCDDGDACTEDECLDGRCRHAPLPGFVGADCQLGRLFGKLRCDGGPIGRPLHTLLTRRIAKARALLRRATGDTRPRRVDRLLARAERTLAAAERRALRSDELSPSCGAALGSLLRERRHLLAGLRTA